MDKWIIWTGLSFLFLTACFVFLLWKQRQRYEQELEDVSKMLGKIISNEDPHVVPETEDSLVSKIQHQILRLKGKVDASSQKAEKDRDTIRSLILEIAHQLRMPLANMEAYLELLKEEDLAQEERLHYITALESSEKQLSFLIESFIKMSRLETKVIQLRKTSQDIYGTIESAAEKAEKKAKNKKIDIVIEKQECLSIPHDRNWLSEAIFNFLDNSVKYSKAGSKIHISASKNEMFLKIHIRDWGIGIGKHEEHDIFKRFYRGKNLTGQEGFGLGLYISREIIGAHNGFVKVKREDPGTSFFIFLNIED